MTNDGDSLRDLTGDGSASDTSGNPIIGLCNPPLPDSLSGCLSPRPSSSTFREEHHQSIPSLALGPPVDLSGELSLGVNVKTISKRRARRFATAPIGSATAVAAVSAYYSDGSAGTGFGSAAGGGRCCGESKDMGDVVECDGIRFKRLRALSEERIERLRTEKIKPIEQLTFQDIKTYSRNQLRAYCYVYGIKRKKKGEMEKNMARYSALFHPGDPNYDPDKYVPIEYSNGPVPRRKVPVSKAEKELAAGNIPRIATGGVGTSSPEDSYDLSVARECIPNDPILLSGSHFHTDPVPPQDERKAPDVSVSSDMIVAPSDFEITE